MTLISAISAQSGVGLRFAGIKLTKTGCCYQGVYTPDGDNLTLNGHVTGSLRDSKQAFKRFMQYKNQSAKADSAEGKQLQHRMRRHIQHRLEEGLLKNFSYRRHQIPGFLTCAAMFKEYAGYIQDIQVSADKSKVTFRVGYPNAATPQSHKS